MNDSFFHQYIFIESLLCAKHCPLCQQKQGSCFMIKKLTSGGQGIKKNIRDIKRDHERLGSCLRWGDQERK